MKKKIIILGILFSIPVLSAHAAPGGAPAPIVSDVDGVIKIVDSISGWIYSLAFVFSTLMVLYAAFVYITAAGNSEKVQEANKMILYAVVGVAIAILASSVPLVVSSILHTAAQ